MPKTCRYRHIYEVRLPVFSNRIASLPKASWKVVLGIHNLILDCQRVDLFCHRQYRKEHLRMPHQPEGVCFRQSCLGGFPDGAARCIGSMSFLAISKVTSSIRTLKERLYEGLSFYLSVLSLCEIASGGSRHAHATRTCFPWPDERDEPRTSQPRYRFSQTKDFCNESIIFQL